MRRFTFFLMIIILFSVGQIVFIFVAENCDGMSINEFLMLPKGVKVCLPKEMMHHRFCGLT